jgi:hypothetical protein
VRIPSIKISPWTRTGSNDIYRTDGYDGYVGIGTSTPNTKLTIDKGAISMWYGTNPTPSTGFSKIFVDSSGNLKVMDEDGTISSAGESYARVFKTSEYDSINDIITLIEATGTAATILVNESFTVSSTTAIPSYASLSFIAGYTCTVSAGVTFTINGDIDADLLHVFVVDAGGTLSIKVPVYPEWWGKNITPGTTDMATALQSAIDAVSGSDGIVVLSNTYLVGTSVELKSNISLIGRNGKIIQGVSNESVLTGDSVSNVRIERLELQGVDDDTAEGTVGAEGCGIFIDNSTDVLISENKIHGFSRVGIYTTSTSNLWIEKNTLYGQNASADGGYYDIGTVGTSEHNTVKILNNICISPVQVNIFLNDLQIDFEIVGNTVKNSEKFGINVYRVDGTEASGTISNNYAELCGWAGINLEGRSTPVQFEYKRLISISNNILKSNGGTSEYDWFSGGITINRIQSVQANNNIIDGYSSDGYDSHGIVVYAGSQDISLDGNSVSSVSGSGVVIMEASHDITVQGGTISSCNAHGILVTAAPCYNVAISGVSIANAGLNGIHVEGANYGATMHHDISINGCVSDLSEQHGFYFRYARDLTVTSNIIKNGSQANPTSGNYYGIGFDFSCTKAVVVGNKIINETVGQGFKYSINAAYNANANLTNSTIRISENIFTNPRTSIFPTDMNLVPDIYGSDVIFKNTTTSRPTYTDTPYGVGQLYLDTTLNPDGHPIWWNGTEWFNTQPHVFVSNYGATGDGVTDDTTAIQNALDAADGKKVIFTSGTYNVTSSLKITNKNINVYFEPDAYIDASNYTDTDPILDISGSVDDDDFRLLGADGYEFDRTIEVHTDIASTVVEGDILFITTSDQFGTAPNVGSGELWNTAQSIFWKGEMAEVESVSGTTVTLKSPINDDYTAANTIVAKVSYVTGRLDNIRIKGKFTDETDAIRVAYAKNYMVNGGEVTRAGDTCLGFSYCYNTIVYGFKASRFFKSAAFDAYGIAIGSYCTNFLIQNCIIYSGTHGIVQGGQGVARYITIDSCIVDNQDTAGKPCVAHHQNTQYFRVTNNILKNGITFPHTDVEILNNHIYNHQASGPCYAAVNGPVRTCRYLKIEGNTIIDNDGTGNYSGIQFYIYDGWTAEKVNIKNNIIETVNGHGIEISQKEADTCTIEILEMDHNTVTAPAATGVFISGFTTDDASFDQVNVVGNTIKSSSYPIIIQRNNSDSVSFKDNMCLCTNDTYGRALYAYGGATGDIVNLYVEGNVVESQNSNDDRAYRMHCSGTLTCKGNTIINCDQVGGYYISGAGSVHFENNTANTVTGDITITSAGTDNVIVHSGSATPTGGHWEKGSRVYNTYESTSTHMGWVCTAEGTPGTWEEMTVASAQGADGYVAFFTGPKAIAGDNDLFWKRDTNELILGGASTLSWNSSTKLTDVSNGIITLSNNAATQGIKFNTSFDSWLTLTDESDGGITLQTNALYIDNDVEMESGDLYVYDGYIYSSFLQSYSSDALEILTADSTSTLKTGDIILHTGNQTRSFGGDDSGSISIYTGSASGLEDTGDIEIKTGAPAAGTAGDIVFYTDGTNERMKILGNGGAIDVSTKILIPDGSVGSPSITFANDTDLGIYRVTGNDMGFTANGSVKFRVTSSGTVLNATMQGGGYAIQMTGNRIYDSTGELNLGASYSAVHGGTGSVAIGKDSGGISLETEGNIISEGQLYSPVPDAYGTGGTTITLDWDGGNSQIIDLEGASGDVTVTMINQKSGGSYLIKIIQGSVARDIVWESSVYWEDGDEPVITTTDDAVDVVSLWCDGTNYYGSYLQNMLNT